MKSFLRASFVVLVFLVAANTAPSTAAPAHGKVPAAHSNKVEVQRVCHHYRWSSQSRCTSAQVLRYVTRPPLFYPHKYYGGTPHYFARQPAYWHAYPSYYHHRWHYWRHRHHPFYW